MNVFVFECPVRGHSDDNPECTCFKSDADSDEDETECPVTGHSGRYVFFQVFLFLCLC